MDEDIYDASFAEGVANWNLYVINAHPRDDIIWQAMMMIPEARNACIEYTGERYLGLLNDEELFSRYRTLRLLTTDVDEKGFVVSRVWGGWDDKWIHVATEVVLRDLRLDDNRLKYDSGFLRTPRAIKARAAYKRRKLDWGPRLLVKYGAIKFLQPALKTGSIRISPASSYDDPSMNTARRDNELERSLVDDAFELTATLGPLGGDISDDERALYETSIAAFSDYYVFCLAMGYHLRLFDDFDADACLVITDPPRFLKRLEEAVGEQLPGWRFGSNFVHYIDPVQRLRSIHREDFMPFFTKHFRYAYQHEARAVWLPPVTTHSACLNHLFVTLGNLEDYCEILEL